MAQEIIAYKSFAELAQNDSARFTEIMSRQAALLTNAGVVKVGMILDFSEMKLPAELTAGSTATPEAIAMALGKLMDSLVVYEKSKRDDIKLSSTQTTLQGKVVAKGQIPDVLMIKGSPNSSEGLFPLAMLGKSPKTTFVVNGEKFLYSDMIMTQFVVFMCEKKFRVTEVISDENIKLGESNGRPFYSKYYTLESI